MILAMLMVLLFGDEYSIKYAAELRPERQDWLSEHRHQSVLTAVKAIGRDLNAGSIDQKTLEDSGLSMMSSDEVEIFGGHRPDLVPAGSVIHWFFSKVADPTDVEESLIPFGINRDTCETLQRALEGSMSYDLQVQTPMKAWIDRQLEAFRDAAPGRRRRLAYQAVDAMGTLKIELEYRWACRVLSLVPEAEQKKILLYAGKRLAPLIHHVVTRTRSKDVDQFIDLARGGRL